MNFTINNLIEVLDSKVLCHKYENILLVLVAAINDWPLAIKDIDHYKNEISTFVAKDFNRQELKMFLDDVNVAQFAWEAESLSQVLCLFEFYNNEIVVSEILEDVKIQMKSILLS